MVATVRSPDSEKIQTTQPQLCIDAEIGLQSDWSPLRSALHSETPIANRAVSHWRARFHIRPCAGRADDTELFGGAHVRITRQTDNARLLCDAIQKLCAERRLVSRTVCHCYRNNISVNVCGNPPRNQKPRTKN